MEKFGFLMHWTAVSITASVAGSQGAPTGFRGEFLHQFDQSMTRIVALAEAVPSETYGRRPVPAVMPIAQTFAHIARFNYEYPSRAGCTVSRDLPNNP